MEGQQSFSLFDLLVDRAVTGSEKRPQQKKKKPKKKNESWVGLRQQCLTITCSIVAPHVGYGDMHACGSLVLSRIFFSFPFFFFANLSLRYVFREISSYCFGKVHVKGSKRGLLKLKGEDDIEIEKPLISISRQRTSNCLCAYPPCELAFAGIC